MENRELMHYGVKGMKWGVRKAVKKVSGSGLANAYRADYEAMKMRARADKTKTDALAATRTQRKIAKSDYKNRKVNNVSRKEAKTQWKDAKNQFKTDRKDARKEYRQSYKDARNIERTAYKGMNAVEKVLYNTTHGIARETVKGIENKIGTSKMNDIELMTTRITHTYGDAPYTAIENALKNRR